MFRLAVLGLAVLAVPTLVGAGLVVYLVLTGQHDAAGTAAVLGGFYTTTAAALYGQWDVVTTLREAYRDDRDADRALREREARLMLTERAAELRMLKKEGL